MFKDKFIIEKIEDLETLEKNNYHDYVFLRRFILSAFLPIKDVNLKTTFDKKNTKNKQYTIGGLCRWE